MYICFVFSSSLLESFQDTKHSWILNPIEKCLNYNCIFHLELTHCELSIIMNYFGRHPNPIVQICCTEITMPRN